MSRLAIEFGQAGMGTVAIHVYTCTCICICNTCVMGNCGNTCTCICICNTCVMGNCGNTCTCICICNTCAGFSQRVKASGSAAPYLRFPTARYAFNSERYAFALFFRSSSMRCFRRAFDLPARTQQLLLYWLHCTCTCEGARALAHARSPGRLFVPYVRTYK